MRPKPFILLALLLTLALPLSARQAPEYGPAKGTLVIVGGGSTDGTGIIERFIEIAGGPDKKFVIVPTAGGNRNADGSVRPYQEDQVVASWVKRGLKNVRMLHTHDPKVADTEAFASILRDADAVWFNGGRQWNIVDSYAGTLTYREFHNVLARGGVIGGSSAGATIQGECIPPENRGRVFEPYYTDKAEGTGLGLAIDKQAVEFHRGTIGVRETPGGGATFEVRLPVSPSTSTSGG